MRTRANERRSMAGMTAGPGPRRHRPAGSPLWSRLVLLSSVSMAGLLAAVPGQALADGCTTSGTTENCQIDRGGTYDQPAAVTNDGTNGTSGSPNGGAAGDLNFTNENTVFDVNSTTAGSTGGTALMTAESRGGNGDDSGDAGNAGAVVLADKGFGMTLDVNGPSKLQAFLNALSLGGSGDGSNNDDNDTDGGKGGAGGTARITTNTTASYSLTGTIANAFYGLLAQSHGGTGGEQNSALVSDQLGGRGGDAGTAEIDNQAGITYGSSGSRVQASSAVEAMRAESIAGSGGFNNGDAGNAGAVTINSNGLDEVELYLNMQAAGHGVYGLHGYSLGGTGNSSSDNSDQGGNGGSGGDVTITNSVDVRVDVTGQAVGAGAAIAAVSEGGKGGLGPSKDQPGGNGGDAGNVNVTSKDPHIHAAGDYVFGILAESLGGQGGDGSDSTAVAGTGGGGGFGGNAGTVTVTTDGKIETSGAYAPAIAAMSLGGGGGTGSDFSSILGGAAGNGGNGGDAGLVTVHNDAELDTTGDHSYGILAQSTAGSGGAGGVANGFIVELGGDGAAGGVTGNIDIDNHGDINTAGYGAIGILGQSIGGGGGAAGSAGGVIAVGGNAPVSFKADGGTVTVDNTRDITTTGDAAIGMLAQSIGGGGGSAAGATGIVGVGGQGSAGGDGGAVTTQQIGRITTSGDYAFGFLAQSVGGGGGNGGNVLDVSVGVSTGIGGSAAGGGNGGTVIVDNSTSGTLGTIATSGNHATGLLAQSIGNGGGTGGDARGVGVSAVTLQVGGRGGGSGTGGDVTINQTGLSVTTTGSESVGVKAQSIAAGGGDGGGATATDLSVGLSLGIAIGSTGGDGGNGGTVRINLNDSTVTTGTSAAPTDDSTAVFAHSVGGGGGTGGQSGLTNLVLGVPVDEDLDTFSASINLGAAGAGGAGGNGGDTTVAITDTTLTTSGQHSMGIHAQSIGGDGGSGGDSSVYSLSIDAPVTTSINLQAAASVGGLCTAANCGGGNGGDVAVDVTSTGSSASRIITAGDYGNGILAQSIGGSGGNAGVGNVSIYSLFSKVNAGVAIGVGSKGGAGGDGGTAEVTLGAGSLIQTGGSGARGIIAQSVGGGGGTAQGLSLYGTGSVGVTGVPEVPSVTGMINVGMSGGSGGNGNTVTVTNDGTIVTAQRDSDGIVAQSVGGGGGMGGSLGGDSDWTLNNVSNAIKQLKDIYNRFTFSISGQFTVSVGGTGGGGGTGAKVDVIHDGLITTGGDYADGLIAQSIGGGGGIGGSSDVTGYRSFISANVSVGGSGGTGGAGGEVDVKLGSASAITTTGYAAYGVLAQSIGGGGGMGGDGSAISQATLNIGSGTGGGGGSGNDGGAVNFRTVTGSTAGDALVTTSGDNAHGVILQSVGNGGGTGGVGDTESHGLVGQAALELAIGGRGGNAGNGGDINVCSGSAACAGPLDIVTNGDRAVGLLAQSIGGGGGTGGAGDPGTTRGLAYSMALDIGGSGGEGGDGGNVTIGSGFAHATTTGDMSVGFLAQSIGGGGGFGAAGYNVDSTFSGDRTLSIDVGGSGGNGGDGHAVNVSVRPDIQTQGDWAHAVVAQSIGGGGGVAGTTMTTIISGDQLDDVIDSKVIVGGAASGGRAIGDSLNPVAGQEAVTVNLYDLIVTQGHWAMGTIAQSIGGGGGIGNSSLRADGQGTATSSVAVGGGTGSQGNGGDVGVHGGSTSDIATVTSGAGAYGILAQSIGGGGGLGTALTSASGNTLTVGGASKGNGGTVEIAGGRSVDTAGDDAHAIVLQSIGGGGGVGALSAEGGTAQYTLQVGGADGASGNGGTVKSEATLQVLTTGQRAFGLVAQSIGGGGGIAGAGPAAGIHSPDDCCSSGLTIGGQENANGNGGAVDLTIDSSSTIITQGNGSHAVVAQSIGGGGGIGGDASGSTLQLNPTGRNGAGGGSGGDGNTVKLTVDGTIATSGANAFGILAQSIGAGGGFGGDASGAFAGNTDTVRNGSGGIVTVTQSGTISTTGANSVGIFAQSEGTDDNNVVSVTVNGAVAGGSGSQGAGVWIAAGRHNLLTVNAGGSVSAASGTAIRYDGDSNTAYGSVLTINNYGTISGNILLNNTDSSNAGTVSNYSDHTLIDASLYQADVVNQGRMVVGHSGATDGTEITGNFTQGAAGTLVVDTDFNSRAADRLLVRGDAQLGGTLDLQATSLRPYRALTVLTVDGAATGAITPETSPIYGFALTPSGHDYRLSVASADFDADAMKLEGNQSKVARGLQDVWDAGGTDSFGKLFATLGAAADQGASSYGNLLKDLSPGIALAPAQQLQAGMARFNSGLMSCPVFSGTDALTGETDCAWAQVTGRSTQQTADNGTSGFSNDSITYQVGGQHEVAPGWFVGMSAAYQNSWLDAYDDRVSGNGDAGYVGLTVKREIGPWMVAGALSGSYGSFSLDRRIAVPGFEDTVSSDPDVFAGSARLRVARTFAVSEMYLKPYVDLDAIYSRMPGYSENGGGDLGLKVESSDQFTFAFSPSLEIGGRIDLEGGAQLRPYAYAGVSILSDDDWTAKARFTGAPSGTGSFDTSLPIDDVVARIGAGVQVSTAAGFDIRLQYDGEFSDRVSSNSGSLKAILPF